MGVGRGSGLLGTFLCSRLLQNMKFLMPNADYHCAPFLNELHCLFKRIFFFRTDKGKTPKAPQSVMFWGCGTDSLLPPQSSRFSWALSENKHETRKCENPQCFRPPMRTAYSKEIESWYRAITECVRSHLPNQWSFRSHKYKTFFFFPSSFIFVLCSSRRTRRGQKKLFRLATWLSPQKCSNCSCCHCTFMYK